MTGDSFHLAHFDGSFVYLLTGRLTGDTLRGTFHAGLRTQTQWVAVRSTGLSLVYAIGTAVFGGTTQFIVTWLLAATHNPISPAYYLVAMSLISVAAMALLPESRDADVTK